MNPIVRSAFHAVPMVAMIEIINSSLSDSPNITDRQKITNIGTSGLVAGFTQGTVTTLVQAAKKPTYADFKIHVQRNLIQTQGRTMVGGAILSFFWIGLNHLKNTKD